MKQGQIPMNNETIVALSQAVLASLPALIIVWWQARKLTAESNLARTQSSVSVVDAADKLSGTAMDWIEKMEQRMDELESIIDQQSATIKKNEGSKAEYEDRIRNIQAELVVLRAENARLRSVVDDYEKVIEAQAQKLTTFEERVGCLEKDVMERDNRIRQLEEMVNGKGVKK